MHAFTHYAHSLTHTQALRPKAVEAAGKAGRDVKMFVAMSLDGFIAGPQGNPTCMHVDWSMYLSLCFYHLLYVRIYPSTNTYIHPHVQSLYLPACR